MSRNVLCLTHLQDASSLPLEANSRQKRRHVSVQDSDKGRRVTTRELLEMKPLWREPVRLDNRKLLATLGNEPRTPLPEAVLVSLRGIGAV